LNSFICQIMDEGLEVLRDEQEKGFKGCNSCCELNFNCWVYQLTIWFCFHTADGLELEVLRWNLKKLSSEVMVFLAIMYYFLFLLRERLGKVFFCFSLCSSCLNHCCFHCYHCFYFISWFFLFSYFLSMSHRWMDLFCYFLAECSK